MSKPIAYWWLPDDVPEEGWTHPLGYHFTKAEVLETKRIWRAKAYADVCAQCGNAIAPDAPVAIYAAHRAARGAPATCLDCSVKRGKWSPLRITTRKCASCGRPMRITHQFTNRRLPRTCCEHCGYLVKLSSDRAKRKVEQQPRACATCGRKFMPRRKDAVYCSLRCRVAMHRGLRRRM